jgi:CubicO group peptidase (beta-lactamase class C family)
MNGVRYWLAVSAIAAATAMATTGLAGAKVTAAEGALPASVGGKAMTRADVETFFDGIMGQRLERDDIAGAVVVVVKNGRVLFEKGYGVADVAGNVAVRADRTVFRVGSISKTFTGTAVMQLVERGKLDLDADVGGYLDFPLARRYPEPITLRRLLTHTAGFEEVAKDFIDPPGAYPKLGDYLRTHQPEQIFRPGTQIGYSNYGVSLAGYIVERRSGEPFETYVAKHIYAPLGMKHSSFAAPLEPALAALAAKDYWKATQPPRTFDYLVLRPAGGMFSTGDDMSRFMIAHLQDGRYGSTRILSERAAREMHTVQWRGHPDAPGIAINFYQDVGNGRFVLTHGGDTCCQHSAVWLVPSEGTGVFLAFNSSGSDFTRIRSAIWRSLLDRYWPSRGTRAKTSPTAEADAKTVAGVYLGMRRADSNVMSMLYALTAWSKVVDNPDGTISLSSSTTYAGTPTKFRPVGNLFFVEVGGAGHTLGFRRDAQGRVVTLIEGSAAGFERENGLLNGAVLTFWFLAAVLVSTFWLLLWPVGALVRLRFKRPLRDELDAPARRRRLIVLGATIAAVGLVFGFLIFCSVTLANFQLALLSPRTDPLLRVFQLLAIGVVLGAAYAVRAAVLAWRKREGALIHRLALTAATVSLAVLALFVLSYHVLSPSLAY